MEIDELAQQLDDAVVALRSATLPRAGLSLTAAATLARLQRSGPARLTELAGAEGVSQPSMTALIARLADKGLVRRAADPPSKAIPTVTHSDARIYTPRYADASCRVAADAMFSRCGA